MKFTFLSALLCLALLYPRTGQTQCINPLFGPFPLPEYDQYNCSSGICDSPDTIPAPWQAGDSWLLQAPNMVPGIQYIIDFAVDPGVLPFAGNFELTVFENGTNDLIANTVGLQLNFTLPNDGAFVLLISELGNCGNPPLIGGFTGFAVDASCPLPCFLDRLAATNILLSDPDFVFNPDDEILMSPFVDNGFGPGFEGLFPAETFYGPAVELLIAPPPSPKIMQQPGYLFYVDLFPGQLFQHDVIYFYLDATLPDPSIANGGIIPCPSYWWPYTLLPGSTSETEWFGSADFYYSDDPLGPGNIDGLLDGLVLNLALRIDYTLCPPLLDKNTNKCALIFSGNNETRFRNTTKKAQERINMRDCYDKDDIILL